MARHAKFNTSSIPAKSLNPFREWCHSHGLPENTQDSYERYLDAQKSKQGASNGSRSRQKPKACRGPPKYDPEEAAKHKRAIQEQLGKFIRPAAAAPKAAPTTPSKLRAEAPSFTPSPPHSASGRRGTPATCPPAPILPPSPVTSWDGAWANDAWGSWDRAGSSVALADRLGRGFPEYAGLIMAPGSATEGLPGMATSAPDEDEDEEDEEDEEDGEPVSRPAFYSGMGLEAFMEAFEEHLDACWALRL